MLVCSTMVDRSDRPRGILTIDFFKDTDRRVQCYGSITRVKLTVIVCDKSRQYSISASSTAV